MKSPQRVFLVWRRPALLSAVEYLRRKYASGEMPVPPPAAKGGNGKATKRKNEAQRLLGFDEPPGDLRSPARRSTHIAFIDRDRLARHALGGEVLLYDRPATLRHIEQPRPIMQ